MFFKKIGGSFFYRNHTGAYTLYIPQHLHAIVIIVEVIVTQSSKLYNIYKAIVIEV